MYHGASVSAICSIVLSSQGVPYPKSHAISLKHPGQALRHPLTNTEVRHPGPFAMSHVLMVDMFIAILSLPARVPACLVHQS